MDIKNILIGIAVIILASFVSIYGIKTFYGDKPIYEDYCNMGISYTYPINTSEQCTASGGKWSPSMYYEKPVPENSATGWCDLTYYCNQEFTEAQTQYSKSLFIITVPIGIILIAIGAFLFSIEAIGAGIMGGGIVTLIYGAGSYWPNANNMFRFIISLVGLIVLIFIGYWINKEYIKNNKLKKLFSKKK
ncbi:MAG: hypothetical protein WC533_02785 [Candidatus Pacearchaeota archaeon]